MSGLPSRHSVVVFPERRLLMEGAADRVVEALDGLSAPRLVLPGGTTPVELYRELAARRGEGRPSLDPARVRIAFTDERAVPPGDGDSNYGMIRRELLEPLGFPAGSTEAFPTARVLRVRGEDPPERAAEVLDRELRVWSQRVPLFDLVVLGMGSDGHVASLFPDAFPADSSRWALAVEHPTRGPRITLTPRALRSTRRTFLLVAGEEKAPAVRRALEAVDPSPAVPARLAVDARAGSAVWLLDREAASLLPDDWT
jgi:6-phosphogluconolactonase